MSDIFKPVDTSSLISYPQGTFDGYLIQHPEILNDKTNIRINIINSNIDEVVQLDKLCDLIAESVTDYCTTRSEIQNAFKVSTNNARALTRLAKEASSLFVDSEMSGEAGEVLLYLLAESLLEAPQILSKMSLKTSSNMHFHGSDGVHVKSIENGLAIYWGESKIHKDRASAVNECLDSVTPFLINFSGPESLRDLGLIRNNLDVNEQELKNSLIEYFISDSELSNRLSIRAVCLVGFNLSDYPKHIDYSSSSADEALLKNIEKWANQINKSISNRSLKEFHIEFFMIPFENIELLRSKVLEKIKGL